MDHKWLSHVSNNPVEKEEFKNAVLASKPVLDRLITILTKDLQASQREQKKVDYYELPKWELMQADCNASQRTLERVIDLCQI